MGDRVLWVDHRHPPIAHNGAMLQFPSARSSVDYREHAEIYQEKGTAMKFRSFVAASLLALGVLCVAAPALAADVHMFVRHEVADYATWKKAYDGFRATQKKMGVVTQAVYQSVDNPNDVTVTHAFHSLEQAKAFAASPELKSAMEKSGVKGAPQIWYATKSAK